MLVGYTGFEPTMRKNKPSIGPAFPVLDFSVNRAT